MIRRKILKAVLIVFVNLAIFELLSHLGWYFIERHDYIKPFRLSGLYKDVDILRLHEEERNFWEKAGFDPYGLYKAKPDFKGKYFSTDKEGFRSTVQHLKAKEALETKTILFLGGSTMFGSGTPGDSQTIPSIFARLINEHDPGCNYYVKNLGVGGYFNTQEMLLLLEMLGNRKIDAVIFYDWENEPTRALEEFESKNTGTLFIYPHIPLNPLKEYVAEHAYKKGKGVYLFLDAFCQRLTSPYSYKIAVRVAKGFRNRAHLLFKVQEKNLDKFRAGRIYADVNYSGLDKEAQRAVELYRKNKDIIDLLARAYHFKAFFFMQPNLYTKATPSGYESFMFRSYVTTYPEQSYMYKRVFELARKELSADNNFFDISGEITTPETVYYDICHTQGKGNTLVARAIFERIKDKLR